MPRSLCIAVLASMIGWVCAPAARADLAEAQKDFAAGKYEEAIEQAGKAIAANEWGEGWRLLKIRAELLTGKYAEAMKTYEDAVDRYDTSVRVRLAGFDVWRVNDKPDDANEELIMIRALAERAPWRYEDANSRVALGRALMHSGADARQVLELFYDKAKKDSPESAEPYMAAGDLALEKNDLALAAEAFRDALKRSPNDADIYYGLARAHEDDAERATTALTKALEINPKHVPSLLMQADNLIDREAYDEAHKLIAKVIEINPKQHKAWAYRAVLAHLKGDREGEEKHRAEALSSWKTNPEVDHIIGAKLSAKYRFAEGAARQRKALEMTPAYLPAKVQLCNDLLRLGKEDEGWKLADEVFKTDQYNVLAFNLTNLRDHLTKFKTMENKHFLVRMDPREAQIYGQRVMRLLERSKAKLVKKYGIELADPITIEIFPQQKDFAIRTFGLPGGAGFLGVCFGPVITVNSPASRMARPANWEAILWHEFCHTITLTKTHNKMPRWLSEGISVHEERLEKSNWGQVMNPEYREIILKGEATPVSKLSGAFLKPPTPMHLQFAYYQSSMVVSYVIERFGQEALVNVLNDLARDIPINSALAKHTEPIEKLDENFDTWFKEQAEALAKGVNWERPKLDLDAGSAELAAWNKEHPDAFWGLLGEGRALLAEKKFAEAKKPLMRSIELYPVYGEAGGPYLLMAAVHRELKEAADERKMLEKHLALSADAVEPRLRLMEVAAEAKDWALVKAEAEAVLAINPLTPAPHRYLAQAAVALGERSLAIEAHRTLLLLDPLDRAAHHYAIAKMLFDEKQTPAARREVVLALEEAPRFRDAQKLLLEIVATDKPATRPTTKPAKPPTPEAIPR